VNGIVLNRRGVATRGFGDMTSDDETMNSNIELFNVTIHDLILKVREQIGLK
jgi:hypothetical protein